MAPGATGLVLDHLTWRPASRRLPTIDDLTLRIEPGQHVLLAGASGSGKSTVLTALAGLLDETTGELTGAVRSAERPGERGLLLQNPVHALVGDTVGRDAAFGPENVGMPREGIQAHVTRALQDAAVDVDATRRCLDASGGQQQRIALAGSLALSPGALLLDEPTSMLDPFAAERVRTAVLEAARDRTLVLAEHRVGPWLEHVDRLVVLGPQARILADGPPARLLAEQRELLEEAGLRLPGASAPEPRTVDGRRGEVVLTLRDLAVGRRGARGRGAAALPPLLEHLDLEVRTGDLVAVTGPSGAGKTSLLRVVLGVDAPDGGSVSGSGTGEGTSNARAAWVPQDPEHAFVAATVAEEVAASPRAEDPELAASLLREGGLDHLAQASPYALSGGEQRRLAVVAALAERPALLVLDEPTVGLDAHRWADVVALLDAARARGTAVLVATHDPDLVARADHVLRLDGGPVDGAPAVAPDTRIGRAPRLHRAAADRLNPLIACLVGILGAIGSVAVDDWRIGLVAAAPTVLLAPLASRTARGTLLRLAPVLLSVLGLAWSTALLSDAPALSGEAWLLGLKEALRIFAFVAPGVLVMGCVDPTALGDALGGVLRLPGRVVAASVGGLVRAGQIGRDWDVIMTARRLRGLGSVRSWRHPLRTLTSTVSMLASATFALLVGALRSASWQALAMDARGFARADHRTWALPSPFTRADVVGLGIGVLLLVLPWAARLAGL